MYNFPNAPLQTVHCCDQQRSTSSLKVVSRFTFLIFKKFQFIHPKLQNIQNQNIMTKMCRFFGVDLASRNQVYPYQQTQPHIDLDSEGQQLGLQCPPLVLENRLAPQNHPSPARPASHLRNPAILLSEAPAVALESGLGPPNHPSPQKHTLQLQAQVSQLLHLHPSQQGACSAPSGAGNRRTMEE